MNRLQAELQRLFALDDRQRVGGANGATRVMVLEVGLPSGWGALGVVWRAVLADLGLPAPAIAVSGRDSYQLWFSVDAPLPRTEALSFLQGLRRRYLAEVPAEHIRMFASVSEPAEEGRDGPEAASQGAVPPPSERAPGRWSAFVAADLAALFSEEHWLDMAPSGDAQADLLARLLPARVADLRGAAARLAPAAATADPGPASGAGGRAGSLDVRTAIRQPAPHPRSFLLAVMNNASLDLSHRIEAAKALLPYCGDAGGGD